MIDWINVKDRLPKKTAWVLVCGDGAVACRAYNKEKNRFEDWEKTQCAGLCMEDITHWAKTNTPEEKETKND